MTIVDIHTHVFWYPDHLSDELVDDALAAKRVKAERSGGKSARARLKFYTSTMVIIRTSRTALRTIKAARI